MAKQSETKSLWGGDPIVIDPPGFSQQEAWDECRDYVDKCGGLTHEDGEPNWRAAFGADPGICSCPKCRTMYWQWGRRQLCKKCGFEYPTDAWPMYSYGVQAAWRKSVASPMLKSIGSVLENNRMGHPYFSYGYNNPPPQGTDLMKSFESLDHDAILAALRRRGWTPPKRSKTCRK